MKQNHEIGSGFVWLAILKISDWAVKYAIFEIQFSMFSWAKINHSLKYCKGQLISKCLFGVFNFLQKTNKTSLIVVKLSLFVRFLEETLA